MSAMPRRTVRHSTPTVRGELVAELGLVQVADRLRPVVERSGVEGGPSVVGPVDEVGDHHVGVEVGVAGARGAVSERSGDEPVAIDDLGSAMASPASRCFGLEHRERFTDGDVVRLADGSADVGGAEAVEDRHRLRSAERRVERRRRSARTATL
jgi:hypothetical protein